MYLVGQLSKLTKISIRTLHYYDEIGLLKPTIKTDAGYRYYTKDDLISLQQILALKKLGFKLSVIKKLVIENDSKIERWNQVFEMELKSIEMEKKRLEQLESSLHAIKNSLALTGDVKAEDILMIIQSIQNNNGYKFLSQYFSETEQSIIREQFPDLTKKDVKTLKWIELLREVHALRSEPIDSMESQKLAKKMMQYISDELQVEDTVLDKYWDQIKPNDEHDEKVLGLDKTTMEYIEKILYYYEHYGEGSTINGKK